MGFLRLTLLILACLLTFSTSALADPARVLWDGSGTGGVNVPGAEVTAGQGAATVSGAWFRQTGLLETGDTASRFRYGLGVMYAPMEGNRIDGLGVEFGLALGGSSTSNDRGHPDTLASFGDLTLSTKGIYRITDELSAGVRARLILPHGVSGHSGYGDTASYAGEAVGTWRSGDFAAHLVAGFLFDRTINLVPRTPSDIERFAWQQTDFHQVLMGLSANYEQDLLDYTLEFSGEVPVGADAPGFSAAPLRLTPGIRVRPWEALEVQLAANVALARSESAGVPAQPAYDVLAALRWSVGGAEPTPEPSFPASPAPEPEAPQRDEPAPAPVEEFEPLPGLPERAYPADATPETEPGDVSEMEHSPDEMAIRGRVVARDGDDPIAGVKITLFPEGLETETDTRGGYAFADLSPGTRLLRLERDGYATRTVTADVEDGEPLVLDITLVSAIPYATVTLTVTDGEGTPVSGADVRLGGQHKGQTDAAGQLTVEKVRPATLELTVLHEQFHDLTREIPVGPDEQREESVTLQALPRPGYLDIRVMGPERNPIEAMVVIEGKPQSARRLDPAAGSTTLYRLSPGTYRLRIESEGFAPEVREVEIIEDGEAALNVRMEAR